MEDLFDFDLIKRKYLDLVGSWLLGTWPLIMSQGLLFSTVACLRHIRNETQCVKNPSYLFAELKLQKGLLIKYLTSTWWQFLSYLLLETNGRDWWENDLDSIAFDWCRQSAPMDFHSKIFPEGCRLLRVWEDLAASGSCPRTHVVSKYHL